jgi:DNA replication protein DnaC
VIDKPTQTEFFKEDIPYDIFSREVVQSIKNPVALGMYCYLMSKPANWVPCRTHLMNHFDIGRDRYQKAMDDLKALGVVYVLTVRNDKGQIIGKRLCVEAKSRVSHSTVSPPDGFTSSRINRPIKDTEIFTDTESIKDTERLPPKKQTFNPPTLGELDEYAKDKGLSLDSEQFWNHWENRDWKFKDGKGAKMKDWRLTVNNWVKNDFNKKPKSNTEHPIL